MVQPQQLRVLIAVRDHGSLTAAAAALDHQVPTISHHLRALEAHLQVPLVESGRRGTTLTEMGEAVAAEGESILARIAQVEREVAARRDAGVTTLRIGTFASIGARLLPAAIRELQRDMELRVEVVEAEPLEVAAMLRDQRVHAGVVYDSAVDPALVASDLHTRLLVEEPYLVMVAADDPLADDEAIDLSRHPDLPWIGTRSGSEAPDRVLRSVHRRLGVQPSVLMRTDDLNMVHGLVAGGLGHTLTTPVSMDPRFAVVARPAVQDLGRRRTSLIRLAGDPPPVLSRLEALLLRAAGEAARR